MPVDQDTSLQTAALWFARRHRGVMTIDEKAEYEAWRVDARNASAMDQLERAWALAGLTKEHFAAESASAARRTFARTAVLAFMCVISLGVGIVSYAGHSSFWTRLDWVER